jgi:peptidoglycan/LPS O-acetylase OafA/YrhL
MNDQTPIREPEPFDRREARRQRREQRLADPSRGGAWVTGLILILLGGMFLLRNTGTFDLPLRNWWALFILIPAIGAFDSALRTYRNAGNQLTAPARSSLLVGTVLAFVTIMFLFDVSWTFFGPILIILVGLGIIFNYAFGNRE